MKTEISRNSRQPDKRYSGVYQQQGRMFTDADWNELTDLIKERLNSALGDVIADGVPRDGGLHVTPDAKLRPGRIYVDGVPAELVGSGADVALDAQPDFPAFPAVNENSYLLYADVWERTVTALEDERLLDSGLHGADTTSRTQTMLQIKWCAADRHPEEAQFNPRIGDALLTLKMRKSKTEKDNCDPCAEIVDVATRTGNYLMRVEVHDVTWVDGKPEKGVQSLVLKWSAENGAMQYAVGDVPDGYKQPKRVYEFFNEASDKQLGVHLVKVTDFPVRGKLHAGFPDTPPADCTHVRRWDGYCEIDVAAGKLLGGVERGIKLSTTNAAGSIGHVDPGSTLGIVLTAMKLSLELGGRQLVAGDYWLGEVREDAADVNALLPDATPPAGIRHHYLTLASVDPSGVTPVYDGDCRRHGFPPLNDIRASDVCYDNTTCKFPDAKTVQQALDHLCRQRGLKWHHKHLHGWGIVCGLQLECAPYGSQNERQHIIIQKGSAIDCEGGDIILDHARRYPVIEQAMEVKETAEILKGKGDIVLSLGLREGPDSQPEFFLEPYDPKAVTWQERLSGTLLMDFFEDCIKEPLEAVRAMFKPDAQSTELVSKADERLITLLNLLIQKQDYANGRYVFLSPSEGAILSELYTFFRELLDSETYCAMFDDQPDFPDYPFPDTQRTTIFGPIAKWREHDRLRIHPDGSWGCTLGGGDSHIHVYDLDKQAMVAELAHPGGEACAVRDVAFSPDGGTIYASALTDNKTTLAIGKLDGYRVKWAEPKIICDLQLVSLATSEADPFVVYGVAEGKGLYLFDPTASPAESKLIEECNATGHLVIPLGGEFAFITAGKEPGIYNEVRAVPLPQAASEGSDGTSKLVSHSITDFGAGEDDIAVVIDGKERAMHLFVVAGLSNPAGQGTAVAGKRLLQFIGGEGKQLKRVALEDTQIRLAPLHGSSQLLVTFADSFRMARLDVWSGEWVDDHVPVQMLSGCMAVDAKGERIFVLNEASHTINPIPGVEEKPIDKEELAKYRDGVLAAFFSLTTHLAQYLKDCFCHHLLINCPECSDEDKIYLGSISIRGGEVYKVCNFSRRKYVKSFPAIGYWMSLLPVGPLLDWATEAFCCWVIPDPKKDYLQPPKPGKSIFYSERPARKLQGYAKTFQKADISSGMNRQWQRMRIGGGLVGEGLGGGLVKLFVDQPKNIDKTGMIGQPVELARGQLENSGMKVVDIKEYTPDMGLKPAIDFASTPEYLSGGDKVVLYQQNGKVKYYAVQPQSPVSVDVTPDMQAKAAAMEQSITDLKAQSAALDASIAKQRGQLDAAASQQVALTSALADVQGIDTAGLQDNLDALQKQKQALQGEIAAMQGTDFSALQATLDGLESKRQDLEKQMTAAQDQFTDASKSMDGVVAKQKAALDGLAKQNDTLAKQIQVEQATDFSAVQDKLDTMQKQQQALQKSVTAMQKQVDLAGMQATLDKLSSQQQVLAKQVTDIQSQSAEASSSLDATIGKQQAVLDAVTKQSDALSKAIEAEQGTDFAGMQAALDKLSSTQQELAKQMADIQSGSSEVSASLTKEDGALAELQSRKEALAAEVAAMQEQSSTLAATLADQTKAAKSLQGEINGLADQRASLLKQVQADRVAYSPVSRVAGVDASAQALLSEAGIRTVADLSVAAPADLASKFGIDATQASDMVAAANKMLKG